MLTHDQDDQNTPEIALLSDVHESTHFSTVLECYRSYRKVQTANLHARIDKLPKTELFEVVKGRLESHLDCINRNAHVLHDMISV
jgi:hypothetical protein